MAVQESSEVESKGAEGGGGGWTCSKYNCHASRPGTTHHHFINYNREFLLTLTLRHRNFKNVGIG